MTLHDSTSASVTYAVASGVSAVLGYTTVDTKMKVLQLLLVDLLGMLVQLCHSNLRLV
jgi:carbon starvation protein CstA